MTPNEFKEFVKEECDKYNVRFKAVNAQSMEGCAGHFLDYDKPNKYVAELVICVNKSVEEWLPVLVHEYCHFLQWKNDVKVWRDLSYPENIDSCSEIWHWIDHPHSQVDKIEEHLRNVRVMELNCERRTVSLITKMGLDIDLEVYKRKAFSYINLYNSMAITRKWPRRGYMPYSIKEIWERCPASLNGSFEKAPLYYINLVNKYCFKGN